MTAVIFSRYGASKLKQWAGRRQTCSASTPRRNSHTRPTIEIRLHRLVLAVAGPSRDGADGRHGRDREPGHRPHHNVSTLQQAELWAAGAIALRTSSESLI